MGEDGNNRLLKTKKLNKFRITTKHEWFELDYPWCEPEIDSSEDDKYNIERIERADGEIVWYGINTNWVWNKDTGWTILVGSKFVECDPPLYEIEYEKQRGVK